MPVLRGATANVCSRQMSPLTPHGYQRQVGFDLTQARDGFAVPVAAKRVRRTPFNWPQAAPAASGEPAEGAPSTWQFLSDSDPKTEDEIVVASRRPHLATQERRMCDPCAVRI